MVLVRVGVLHELHVSLLQLLGQQRRVLVVHVVIGHAVVQHPQLRPRVLNTERCIGI